MVAIGAAKKIGSTNGPTVGPTNAPTDGSTDGPTDGRTDKPSSRDARTHLKKLDVVENLNY